MKLLDKSRSAIYRYIESGDLHPVNTLPPGLARHSRKKRTLRFSRAEVLRLKAKLGRQD